MRFLSALCAGLLLAGMGAAQTPYNAISYGVFMDHLDAAGFGLGSTGLIPAYRSSLSLSNPTTWPDLRFSFLSAHYNTGEIEYTTKGFKSGFGLLSNSTFVLPIKGKYAWGLGLRPLSRKAFSLIDQGVDTTFFGGDTLEMRKSVAGSGGISSLYMALARRFNDQVTVSAKLDFLFGTFSEATTAFGLFGGDTRIVHKREFQFRGTLLSVNLRSSKHKLGSKSTLYLMGQFPLGTRRIVEVAHHAFLDNDGDGEHTYMDDPMPDDVQSTKLVHRDVSLPMTLSAGWVRQLSDRMQTGLEFLYRRCDEERANAILASVRGSVTNEYRASLSLLREGRAASPKLLDRFHYRIGIFVREPYISRRRESFRASGFAVGLGIPFGVTENQIDVGFRLQKANGFLSDRQELRRQITVGITIGDIWLVKTKRR